MFEILLLGVAATGYQASEFLGGSFAGVWGGGGGVYLLGCWGGGLFAGVWGGGGLFAGVLGGLMTRSVKLQL